MGISVPALEFLEHDGEKCEKNRIFLLLMV